MTTSLEEMVSEIQRTNLVLKQGGFLSVNLNSNALEEFGSIVGDTSVGSPVTVFVHKAVANEKEYAEVLLGHFLYELENWPYKTMRMSCKRCNRIALGKQIDIGANVQPYRLLNGAEINDTWNRLDRAIVAAPEQKIPLEYIQSTLTRDLWL